MRSSTSNCRTRITILQRLCLGRDQPGAADGESFSLEACGLKIEVKNVKNHMVDYALVRKLPKPQKTEPETETAGTEQQ